MIKAEFQHLRYAEVVPPMLAPTRPVPLAAADVNTDDRTLPPQEPLINLTGTPRRDMYLTDAEQAEWDRDSRHGTMLPMRPYSDQVRTLEYFETPVELFAFKRKYVIIGTGSALFFIRGPPSESE